MVVFSGLDCSGKSTQIEILRSRFSKKGNEVLPFWSRGGYTPGMQKLKDISRIFLGKKLPKPGKTKSRENAFRRPFIRKLWLFLAILDLIFFYAVYLRYKKLLGYQIICDRYILDTGIDFALNFPQENIDKWMIWKFLNVVALKPDRHFVSLIPVDVSVKRSKQKFEPFPDSPEVLQKRLDAYQKAINQNNELIFLDGLMPIEEVSKVVSSTIEKKYREDEVQMMS